MDLRPWHYWTNAGRPMAPSSIEQVEVLERTVMRNPDHPGACHYRPSVERPACGQGACRGELQTLVPGAGHLVHMPTHIYMRLGMWDLAVEHNRHAVAVDEKYIQDRHPTGVYPMGYYFHNYDVMAAALAMLGRGSEAIAAAGRSRGIAPYYAALQVPALEAYSVAPFYALARFGKWDNIWVEPPRRPPLRAASGTTRGAYAFAAKGQYQRRDGAGQRRGHRRRPRSHFPAGLIRPGRCGDRREHFTADMAARRGNRDAALADLRKGITSRTELTYSEPADWYLPLRQPLGALLLAAGHPETPSASTGRTSCATRTTAGRCTGSSSAPQAQKRNREADSVAAELKRVWAKADVTLAADYG